VNDRLESFWASISLCIFRRESLVGGIEVYPFPNQFLRRRLPTDIVTT